MSKLLIQVLQANIYFQPIQFFLSIVTNLLNIRVFSSRTLSLSPCTHYLRAYAVFSIVYTCLACPTQFLRGFHIDWANTRVGCKLHFYFLFLFPFQANLMLILASFDRYCCSSKSFRICSKSTIRLARINIIVTIIISSIYMSPMLIIYKWNDRQLKCVLHTTILIRIYVFSQIFLYYMLAPMVMFTLGLLTISKIRRQSMHVKLVTASSIRRRRTEQQLTRMLLVQVIIHIILIFPFGVIYSMNSLNSSTQTADILAIRYIFVMWQQLDCFLSFFLYTLSGRVYRQELRKIIAKCHLQCCTT
ncbi:unnamed protein product [Adineta ricciae]|uniref:G-protein coupled receptors family 1 profile domain-containing protein n=1 Tax=Adineta ricciae TaxID=249248 RepID=A0A814YAI9_ADIRI|nr:unnamed protein product [Adineta ricciae]